MSAPKPDPHSELRAAFSAGAMILANEGRHGRPDTYHACPDPKFTCEPHEYIAVVPYAAAGELIEASRRVVRAFEALGKTDGWNAQRAAHRECEDALVAQKSALARLGGAS